MACKIHLFNEQVIVFFNLKNDGHVGEFLEEILK